MKFNSTLFIVMTVIVSGIFAACSPSVNDDQASQAEKVVPPQNENIQLPSFTMTDAGGNIVNLSAFKGKKIFVNLWATWCPPCRAEIPSIESLAGKINKEQAVFIMLSLDENFDVAKEFALAKKMKLPVYYPAEKLPALFNTEGIPATFIFNEQGQLLKQINGAVDYSTDAYYQLMSATK